MIKKLSSTILFSCLVSSTLHASSADDLNLFAQDYKPFSYEDEKGTKRGLAIDIMSEILKKIGSSKSVQTAQVQKFSRSFIRHANDENTVFFPLAKLQEREKYFKWVGPIAQDEPVIYAKKSKHIKISSIDDLKKYKIAGRDEYPGVKQLKDIGLRSSNFDSSDTDKDSFTKIANDNVDVVVCSKIACLSAIKDNKLHIKEYEIIYSLEKFELAIAINKDTDESLVQQMSTALEELKKSKDYEIIVKKYSN